MKKGFRSFVLGRPGNDLLFRVLRRSTIGSKAFNDRVRDGIGFGHLDIATRPAKDKANETGFCPAPNLWRFANWRERRGRVSVSLRDRVSAGWPPRGAVGVFANRRER